MNRQTSPFEKTKQRIQDRSRQVVWDLMFYFCAFAIPVCGMLFILFSRHFYPFGENTLFTGDMREQYAEFYASLRYIAGGDNSVFCSFARSWGGNYLGLFAYYLASPLSWIVNLFSIENLYVGILVLTLLKIGAAGLTFALFARSVSGQATPSSEHIHVFATLRGQFLLLPLSVSYALMSYNIVYSQALMWLDGVILLPLVILGVEKLLNGRKGLLLILSLTAAFLCNYYTGYMIALFSTLYVLFRLAALSTGNVRRIMTRFAFCGLLSAGFSAPLLVPVVLDLFTGKLTGTSVAVSGFTSFSVMDFLRQLVNGSYASLTYSNVPYIYCGYLTSVLAIIFFLIKKIPVKEKISAFCMLTVLFFGMYINRLNIVWHGFKTPNSYPFRDSFLFSFFLLYLALKALSALCSTIAGDSLHDSIPSSNISTLHGLLTRSGRTGDTFFTLLPLFTLLMLFVSADMGLNGRAMLFHVEDEYDYDTINDYSNYLLTIKPLISEIRDTDEGFYRVNQLYEYSKNDAMLWGYNGLSHYSSTYNQSVNELTKNLGMSADWLWNAGYGTTPLTDSMLSVKYVLARYALPEHYTLLSESGYGTASYENPTALPIAYSAYVSEWTPDFGEDVFRNQNLLLGAVSRTSDVISVSPFYPVSFETTNTGTGFDYIFTASSADPIYLMMPSDQYTHTDVYVNSRFAGNYFSSETTCCLYLGTFTPGESVTVDVRPSAPISVSHPMIYGLSMDNLNSSLDTLRQGGMQIVSHKNGHITGTISLSGGQSIVTSIPYDKGWTVRIDGKKIPSTCFANTFLAVSGEDLSPISPGTHTVTFSYRSPGILPGLAIFCLTLLFGVVYFVILEAFSRSTTSCSPKP